MARKLSLETMNPRIRDVEDVVRGPMVQRALQIEKQFQAGATKPFPNVLHANIGDPQAMGIKVAVPKLTQKTYCQSKKIILLVNSATRHSNQHFKIYFHS